MNTTLYYRLMNQALICHCYTSILISKLTTAVPTLTTALSTLTTAAPTLTTAMPTLTTAISSFLYLHWPLLYLHWPLLYLYWPLLYLHWPLLYLHNGKLQWNLYKPSYQLIRNSLTSFWPFRIISNALWTWVNLIPAEPKQILLSGNHLFNMGFTILVKKLTIDAMLGS